ncbi:DUF3152 domain-containing protein [Streptomyces sp. NPDC030392]|uniref:DUF3152 domain-containing protein n=1 Tax=Streptomyces sp. NPDC030392 TaxID=3155468 RepID=UPI0033E4ECAA
MPQAPLGPRRHQAPQAPQGYPGAQAPQGHQSPQAGPAQQSGRAPWDPNAPHGPAPQQYGYGYGFGTPAHGTPAHGTPQGMPAHGTPAHGTPAHGTPAQGTPAHGTPAQGAPAQGAPVYEQTGDVRGGHPEQREPGGAWGTAPYAAAGPPQQTAPQPRVAAGAPRIPGPRREFVEAFDAPGAQAASTGPDDVRQEGDASEGGRDERDTRNGPPSGQDRPGDGEEARDGDVRAGRDGTGRGGKGRTYTGIAAAAVVTVLAVVVAGQVGDAHRAGRADRAVDATDRGVADDAASRSDQRATPPQTAPSPPAAPAKPPTYEQLMARQFPLDAALKGSGEFAAVPGADPAPGKGQKIRYRVDVEKGLGLDGGLFARAVHETLNDDRSWAHGGAMTFERVSSGKADFVITLASPGTTGVWCAKSGLDTTIDNVSCDSASTDRVMINAYRWAQGAETFGPKAMLAYRQMLINHEVGHRLGHNHRTCQTPGALAPVMQQQTKSLEIDGIKCRPNPWVFPGD